MGVSVMLSSPLQGGEVGAKRRVRGSAPSTDRNPSPEFLTAFEIRPLPMGEVSHSLPGIALLSPGIAAVMIAADFPIAGCVVLQELDRLQPFRALPEIEMWH